MVSHYISDGAIGIDLNTVASARAFTLGETHRGNGGSEFVYVVARSALTQGQMVVIDTGYGASAADGTSLVAEDHILAFAQTAFGVSQCGFVARSGQNLLVRVLGGVGEAGQPLYTTDTSGALATTTATASQFQVWGVYLHASVSASGATASVATAAVSFPFLKRPHMGV